MAIYQITVTSVTTVTDGSLGKPMRLPFPKGNEHREDDRSRRGRSPDRKRKCAPGGRVFFAAVSRLAEPTEMTSLQLC